MTEYDFSTEYLEKSKTYFAYLKCTGADASSEALLNLWGKLSHECNVYRRCSGTTEMQHHREKLLEWALLYDELGNDVFEVIEERAVRQQH